MPIASIAGIPFTADTHSVGGEVTESNGLVTEAETLARVFSQKHDSTLHSQQSEAETAYGGSFEHCSLAEIGVLVLSRVST